MVNDFSPEERLLKLIRKKDFKASSDGVLAKAGGPAADASVEDQESGDWAKIFNKVLVFAAFALICYAAYEFLYAKKEINDPAKDQSVVLPEADMVKITSQQPKPYSYYEQQLKRRDIFESPVYKSGNQDAKPVASSSELTKNLRLVGIVLDEKPEAIIEDVELKETMFVHKGESVKDAVVDEIKQGKVILIYRDQKIELVQ
ncbi:MAG: hypothetical protein WC676_01155 [Candidatus Omnitrophota bacterium]